MMRGFVCLLLCLLIPAQALAVSQSPYPGYTYDVWGRSVPAPSGYVCHRVVFPQDQGAGEIKKAQDLFVYQDNSRWNIKGSALFSNAAEDEKQIAFRVILKNTAALTIQRTEKTIFVHMHIHENGVCHFLTDIRRMSALPCT